jgi:hypothetical protein
MGMGMLRALSKVVMGLSLDLLSYVEAAGTCGYRLEPHLRRAHAV